MKIKPKFNHNPATNCFSKAVERLFCLYLEIQLVVHRNHWPKQRKQLRNVPPIWKPTRINEVLFRLKFWNMDLMFAHSETERKWPAKIWRRFASGKEEFSLTLMDNTPINYYIYNIVTVKRVNYKKGPDQWWQPLRGADHFIWRINYHLTKWLERTLNNVQNV